MSDFKVNNVMIFPNGTIAVFDEEGQQIPELQNGWVDFDALRKLAPYIVRDKPTIEGSFPLDYNPLMDYVLHYEKYPSLLKEAMKGKQ